MWLDLENDKHLHILNDSRSIITMIKKRCGCKVEKIDHVVVAYGLKISIFTVIKNVSWTVLHRTCTTDMLIGVL